MGVKAFFKTSVPFLAAASEMVGGPFGNLAAAVLTKVTGTEVKPTAIADVMQGLTTSEAGMLQLKAAEQDYQLKAAALGFDSAEKMAEAHNADTDSARKREIAVRDRTPAVLACLAVIGLVFAISLLAFHVLPAGSESGLLVLIGGLAASYKDVYGYYFGSSAGSQSKDSTIQKLATP